MRVWDGAAGGAALLTLEGHTNYVSAVACHSVGEGSAAWRVVSGSGDKTVRACRVPRGTARRAHTLLFSYALDVRCLSWGSPCRPSALHGVVCPSQTKPLYVAGGCGQAGCRALRCVAAA